jgi:ZIP family zinc transporter
VFLAVGAGAILQVIYEVGRLLMKDSEDSARQQGEKIASLSTSLSAPNLAGLTAGIAIMYATGLLIAA